MPTTRCHRHPVARCHTQTRHVCSAQTGRCRGLQRIEYLRATSHAAGVPMLELSTGDQHKGEVDVRQFCRRDNFRRVQLHPPIWRCKNMVKNDSLTRILGRQTGVGHTGFAQQTAPSDAANGCGHGLAHFLKDTGHTLVSARVRPFQAQAQGQVLDDAQIGSGLTGRFNRLQAQLDHAIGVADRACFFRPCAGW